jgi:hypothetical protein
VERSSSEERAVRAMRVDHAIAMRVDHAIKQ